MLKSLPNLHGFKNSYFLAIGLLCLSLGITNPASAEYKKPKTQGNDAPNSQNTGIAATRGSCNPYSNSSKAEVNSATLTALAPNGHVGQSASTNPTFTWYVPDRESYPVEFRLYESDSTSYDGKGKQMYRTKLTSSAGIMTHSLPKQVSLTPGKTYVWQVIVTCDPNNPSESLVVNNRVEIVEIAPTTTSQLNNSTNSVTKANVYARSGLWYDAIAQVATLPNNPQAREATINLISQLAATEQDGSSTEAKNREAHQKLSHIAKSLQPK